MTGKDVFGKAALDRLEGGAEDIVIERDDGYLDSDDLALYFSTPKSFPECERRALEHAKGRVLDLGTGAGRVALFLQKKKFEVVGVDISDGMLEVAKRRGVANAVKMSACDLEFPKRHFATVVAFGNNFGLCGTPASVVSMLKKLRELTTDDGIILAESCDVINTTLKVHLKYHERNRKLGRMPGQIRLRLRYGGMMSDWFDLILCTPSEMSVIAERAGWKVVRFCYFPEKSPIYVGELRKI